MAKPEDKFTQRIEKVPHPHSEEADADAYYGEDDGDLEDIDLSFLDEDEDK